MHTRDAQAPPRRILFVCRGNTCRSPMAEGAFRRELSALQILDTYEIASAGTQAGSIKHGSDPRAQTASRHRGMDISGHVSRNVTVADLEHFDLLIAMDSSVRDALESLAGTEQHSKIRVLMDYAPEMGVRDVPDPWHGTAADYEHALDLISEGVHGLAVALTHHG